MDEKNEGNLPDQEQRFYYPALYLGGVPAEIPKKKKKWWKRTETIAWSDFFQTEKNKMVVYRIIPHSNVTNNTRRLWKAIYKMYEMYEAPGTRLERDGLRFVYREKDSFWFDVIFKQENGQKKIEFYVSTSEYQATKLKRKLENKMSVTIKEASLEQIQVPEENTIIQELKYLKHDIFSLNTNANEQKTPIAAVMNTIDELQFDGDFARLSICNEAENRQKWIKNASWAYEKLSKGKVPQRATINSRMVLGASKQALGGFVNEVNFLITDLFNALANTFFKSNKSYEKGKVVDKPFSLEDEINSRHISNASREKLDNPVFKSHIRIAAHSQDRLTRETISETLSLAYSEIADNNEIHGVKINIKSRKKEVLQELNTLHLSNRTKMNGNVNLISTDEMAKLAMQMPTAELQRRYEEALNVKKRTETDIPSVLQNPKNLLIGYAEHKDKKINVGLQADQKEEFYCGYTFIGKQGSGKDNSIQNFVYEGAMKHNISFVIPDWICQPGHKGMADGIRDLLPPEKIIDLDLSNEDYIIPMDLTEVIEKLGRKGGSRFALEMIDFMNLEGLARSEKYLMEAAKASKGSLYNIKKIIEDEDYRVDRISELLEEGYERLAKELLQWGDNEELSNKCDAILSRLNMFFGDDTLHDIFAQQPKENVNFEKWMKEGKVIIIRMPKRKLGAASNILAHWVTLKVLMTRMLMSEEDKDRHGCFLIFNEVEQVESKGLAKLMGRIATEGRKERLGSIFAFHHWGKLPEYLQDNLIAGGVNQFLFANDHKRTFELVKERLQPTFTVEDALRTPKYYSIAILNTKEPLHAFMLHMSPPIEDRYNNTHLTIEHAEIYGRHWKLLQ
ncbi:ATP-binding protein [Bacillus cereus group sp. BfR-BA-01700]|uniref:ATP-binding protein n=1 Tax=Bacillus cereus group sp. BfR-BA-01700 TaxID=3094884 RepID=UPI0029C37E1B|nr:ATP-binding protein [Bacillus cereus group sp. BfR-BA-01700]MDX5840649.1 ATP-binding protein [Bacillus cereus group sp. BfR-BA-01700]